MPCRPRPSRAAAVRACEQTSATWPAPGVRASSTNSSPTEITETRGFGCTSTLSRPAAASSPTWAGSDDRVPPHGHVTGLDVLTDPAHESRGRHPPAHDDPGGAAVGVPDRDDRIGQRRQRGARDDPHGLPGLQPQRLARTGRDLPDHGQLHHLCRRPPRPRRRCAPRSHRWRPCRSPATAASSRPPRRTAARTPPRWPAGREPGGPRRRGPAPAARRPNARTPQRSNRVVSQDRSSGPYSGVSNAKSTNART